MTLNELKQNEQTITHALRVAAERFEEDAKIAREQAGLGWQRIAEQFDKQAKETTEIADRIDEEGLS